MAFTLRDRIKEEWGDIPIICVPDGIATPRPGITIRSMNRQKYRKTPSFPSQGSKTNIISLSYYALLIARKPLT